MTREKERQADNRGREAELLRVFAHGPEMTGYSITQESSISDNWMDFVLIYALSFSITHRLNLCMGLHPLQSPAITPIIMIGILYSRAGTRELSFFFFGDVSLFF